MLYAVMKNKKFEKLADDPVIGDLFVEQFQGDFVTKIVGEQIVNVFDDKAVANMCAQTLEAQHPENVFSVVELHLISSSVEWC